MTSVARRHEDSGEYSDGSQDIELNNSVNEGGQGESDYDSQGSDSDRSERDPESQETERRVDDDEDRSNPQYIPKRGTFYEHDDRTAASGEESTKTTSELSTESKEGSEPVTERRRAPRKSDANNKWSHDKYNENEQTPKSRDELVAIYGYDIRNEDAPPHARRNRRYGRGPNKYTRTWEDEEAYKRQAAAAQPRKPPNPEDFPHLDAANNRNRKPRTPRPRSKSQPNHSNESLGPSENGSLRRNPSFKTAKKTIVKQNVSVKPVPMKTPVKPAPKREEVREKREERKLPPIENLTITTTVGNSQGQPQRKVNAGVAQQRPVPTEHAKKKPQPTQQPQPQTNPPQSKPLPQQQPPPPQQKQQQQQQQPAGGEQRGGSKRYSSLRQRPLAENYTPQQPQQSQPPTLPQQPPLQQQQNQLQQQQNQLQQQQTQLQQQQQHRYNAGTGTEFTPQANPANPQHPQQLIHQQVHRSATVPQHASSPPHQHPPQLPQHPQQRLLLEQQQQLVAHHPLHNMPPQPHPLPPHGQLPPTQGYAPPAMMPAQYMQSGNGPVFSGAAIYAAPTAPYTHPQMYTPHHNYATQGGVTYFSCAEQEPPAAAPRPTRRPTAAIPIVKPSPHDRAPNSTEKDNIDRIVENMFVRKPWPATHGADSKEKSQSDSRSSQEPSTKESQPNSLTSSSISTDSKPSESRERELDETSEERKEEPSPQAQNTQAAQPAQGNQANPGNQDSISMDA